jgi:hypothetical protein
MRSSRPAIVGKAGIENLTERLKRHNISRPGTKTVYAGSVIMPYYVSLNAFNLGVSVRARCLKPAPAPQL